MQLFWNTTCGGYATLMHSIAELNCHHFCCSDEVQIIATSNFLYKHFEVKCMRVRILFQARIFSL